MNNIFIIGNGFDLDLGWKTRFSDFAKSDYWPSMAKVSKLEEHLIQKKNLTSWFDLECELLNFAKARSMVVGIPNPPLDIQYFKQLHEALTDYLKLQQHGVVLQNSIALQVLRAVCNNGYFSSIYSFNYTDLNAVAKNLNISSHIDYHHVHGSLKDNSIIIGVDESELMKGYEEFHKIVSPHYRSHTMIDELRAANEIVFFGISFGQIDYIYFNALFQDLANQEKYDPDKRKYVTIFTYDSKSRINILMNLKRMGIDRLSLYSQCNFQIIRTSVPEDKKLLDAFLKRLNENSEEAQQRKLDNLAAMLY